MSDPTKSDEGGMPIGDAPRPLVEVEQQELLVEAGPTRRQHLPWALMGLRAFFGVVGAVAPKSAGRLAARMFLNPRRHSTPRRETKWLRRSERRQFQVENHSIATYWWGEGPIVLLLHGWEGRGSQMGAFVAPLVEAGYRVVAVDLPAHGNSSGHSTDGFTCGRVVHALCDQLGVIHGVVAHSFGGSSVLLAMAGGLEIERVVLISPGVKGDTFFTGFAKIIGLSEGGTDELRRVIHQRFIHEDWSVFTPRNLGQVLAAQSGAALIVHDYDDVEVSHSESVELARWSQGARLLSTRGVGHRRILRSRPVIRSVAAFIAGE
jgi:pimeloyl-ACP methyl ester carboxylesterase